MTIYRVEITQSQSPRTALFYDADQRVMIQPVGDKSNVLAMRAGDHWQKWCAEAIAGKVEGIQAVCMDTGAEDLQTLVTAFVAMEDAKRTLVGLKGDVNAAQARVQANLGSYSPVPYLSEDIYRALEVFEGILTRD